MTDQDFWDQVVLAALRAGYSRPGSNTGHAVTQLADDIVRVRAKRIDDAARQDLIVVQLTAVPPRNKVALIKALRNCLSIPLVQAKDVVESALPVRVLTTTYRPDADFLVAEIVTAGGSAQIVEPGDPADLM